MSATSRLVVAVVLVAAAACAPNTTTTPTTTTTTPTTTTTTSTTTATATASTAALIVAAEYSGGGYQRWGGHGSAICATATTDAYTGRPIQRCQVDHVVALKEAYESGGHAWSRAQQDAFSRDSLNHVAISGCVNASKGGRDVVEWSGFDARNSTACGGGYVVTAAGRCLVARRTVAVKEKYGLTADTAEAAELAATLQECGDTPPTTTHGPAAPTPDTTTTGPRQCVHWHAGKPKHSHPTDDHPPHKTGKCRGL